MCFAKNIKYVPPELNEDDHHTRTRRRKLKDLCDPEEATRKQQKQIQMVSQDSQKKDDARKRTPDNGKKEASAGKWESLDQTSQNLIVYHVLKFLRPKEVDRLVADWVREREITLQIVQTKKPFCDHCDPVNRGGEGEAAPENQRGDDCRSLLLFQKYNISYQKYLEDEEIRMTSINQKTTEYLECHPLSLFYDEIPLYSSPTKGYSLDSKLIESSAASASCAARPACLIRRMPTSPHPLPAHPPAPNVGRVPISLSKSGKCVAGNEKQSSKLTSENLANRQKKS